MDIATFDFFGRHFFLPLGNFFEDTFVQEGTLVDKLSRLSLCWCKCIFMFCVGFVMIFLINKVMYIVHVRNFINGKDC